ncbi:MAG: tetratricopeptide repeat protein [Polyangiaceae bacterium]|nr:tetratricopeptide repeat protein [Polyangiaceae bacterium]
MHASAPLPRRRRLGGLASLLVALCVASVAEAKDPDEYYTEATAQVRTATSDIPAIEKAVARASGQERTAEQRIADAVLLIGVKDYERAALLLNQILDKYPQQASAYADALQLLGETYFQSKQHLSARRSYQQIVDRAAEPRFGAYRDKALERLVDVAMRMRDFDALPAIVTAIDAAGVGGDLGYAKGKALYARGDVAGARSALAGVGADSRVAHQARYLLGVIEVSEATPPEPADPDAAPAVVPKGRYARAIESFRAATQLPPDTAEHRHVIDLAWMAMGRLLYETNQFTLAVDAYNRIDRTSPEFGNMLYELAWVYVRLGDVVRAQRALEVLAVAAPNSTDVADAQLLRGDLMLRAGQFEKSLKVYESVRANYESLRDRVDGFLRATQDPGAFFDTLSQEQLQLFETGTGLPPIALEWAREAEGGETAFAIIEDIALCRRLIKQSNDMIDRLNAVLASPNRVRALPGLRAATERGLGLLNALAVARQTMAHGMDEVQPDVTGALGEVRRKRLDLEDRLAMLPVSDADFEARDTEGQRQWNQASQALQRLELEVDTLQATINGLRRLLSDSSQAGVVRDPQKAAEDNATLVEQEQLVKSYRQQIVELRRGIDAGKVQSGFGDKRFVEDAEVRRQYAALVGEELALAAGGAGGADLAALASRLVPIAEEARQGDQRIEKALADLEATVAQKTHDLRQIVQTETTNIVGYSVHLEKLDGEARKVVGGLAAHNFEMVRDRFRNIVLRADVGITEEAWEVREEQLTRVRRLRIERTRSAKRLEEELEEVLDDSGGPEVSP